MKFIEDICQRIVSPPKLRYTPFDLGPLLTVHGKRHDFTVTNVNNLKINGSFYDNQQAQHPSVCVIYLHSMNGSRLQSLVYVEEILKMGLTFCTFDFSGCGNSQGNTISFGANQKYDVEAIVQKLRQQFGIKKVILWGRSMGSACAIKYTEMIQRERFFGEEIQIAGLVLDSCFRSFSELAIQIGNKHSEVPQFLVKAGFYLIKGSIEEKAQFKIDDLELVGLINHIQSPVMFLTSRQDTTVSSSHSQSLYEVYDHPMKKLVYINGMHNQSRDQQYIQEVKEFIQLTMEYNLKTEKKGKRFSRFQKIMSSRSNYILDGLENEQQTDCQCSLLPADNNVVGQKTTRRHKTDYYQKVRVKKIIQSSPYNFRSTKYIPTKQLA